MLFERFISKERNEPPDIDVDFEHERREEVIQHVFEKYGRERAALAATVITYRPTSAIRDVGKALGLDPDVIDRSPSRRRTGTTGRLSATASPAQGLHLDADVMRRLCALVKELLNFPRHLSQHVGGFVIAEEPISELVPIENAAMPERTIIQWDKNDLESLGLLKVDVLALGMLTAMRQTFDLLATAGTGPTRMEQIPREDPETYDMICRADTVGVFQIESRAQMSMLPRLQAAQLLRPGDRDRDRAARARSRAAWCIPICSDGICRRRKCLIRARSCGRCWRRRCGVPIFQEQVMQIAIVAAGFSPGEADQLRRAMGAWQRSGKMAIVSARSSAGHAREWLLARVRRADLQADRRLRRVRLSGIAFGVVRAADVFFELAEMPSPRGVLRRPHQQSADGVLSAGAVAGAGEAAARARSCRSM